MRLPNGKFNFFSKDSEEFCKEIEVEIHNNETTQCDFDFQPATIGYKTKSTDVFYCCERHKAMVDKIK